MDIDLDDLEEIAASLVDTRLAGKLRALIARVRAAEDESRVPLLECKLRNAEAQINAAAEATEMEFPGLWDAQDRKVFCVILEIAARVRAAEVECDRLHKLFDDAGQGEHNVLALIDHYQQEAMEAHADGWQPIETAPTGKTIMLWAVRGRGSKGVTIGHVNELTRMHCTHWQPLPAPPEVTP